MAMITTLGGMALDQIRLRQDLAVMTRQVSTGFVGQTHGDLGAEARRAVSLRGEMARREAYVGAAGTALARMDMTQEVLARLEGIASEVTAEAQRARTLGTAGVETLAHRARSALEEAAALLNTRHDGDFLFAGSDLAGMPVPDGTAIASGAMATAIAAAVGTLTPLNAAAVLADTALIASDPLTRPFSAHLEGPALTEPRRALQLADGERVEWGVLASQDQAGQTALSWGRELLRGLATLAALTTASAAQTTGYDALLAGVADDLSAATRGLVQERSVLGAAEQRVDQGRERHENLLVALRAQLGGIEEVDLAAVSAALRQTELRLQASYETTATLSRLSLAMLLR
jgi:flagellin-like hook-associated protein FlgL